MLKSVTRQVACMVLIALLSLPVHAQSEGTGLANAYPNRIIVSRQDDATSPIGQVITSALAPQDQAAIRQNFTLAGIEVGQITALDVGTIVADLSRPGTALVANSSDYANPLLSGVFTPGNRFYVFLEDAGVIRTALARPDGTRVTTEGEPRTIDGSNKLVLITSGQPLNGIGTLLYPQGSTAAQIQQILQLYRLNAREIRVLDNVSVSLLSSPDTALLTGDAMFADPANDFVLNYAPGMAIYTVETRARLEEVTPDSLKVTEPAPARELSEKTPQEDPEPKTPRTELTEDLNTQAPEVIPFEKSAPSLRTVVQTQDAQGKAITFDTDTALVAWGAPGLLVYLPDPLACGYPAYLYDVTHPILVKWILAAENPWDYVRSARYNYFNAGCTGDWGGSHRGTIVFSYQGQTIGEAAFEFEEGESWNNIPDRLTWHSQRIDPIVEAAGPSLPAYVDFWHKNRNDRSSLPLRDPIVLASLKATETAEAAHYLGVNAPPRWPEKQPALDKAICAGYPLTAYEVASGILLNLRADRAKSIEKDLLDKLRLLTAQAKFTRDVRTGELIKLISSYGGNVDFDTPIAIVEEQGPCLTVAMMNAGPTVDAPPRAGLAAGLLQDELLSNRCNIVSLLTDKYAQRSGGQSAPLPGTRFTPSRFGCTAQWLGARLTLGIAEISDLSCEGGDGRYLCSFDLSFYCRADFGDFGSGTRLGTDDMICGIFTAAPMPGTAFFVREGDGWRVEEFVPAR